MKYDAVIVGAGPAGTMTGYHLARAGFHVLILEKEKLPRYKPCAGAVAARTLDIVDFDISPALEKAIYRKWREDLPPSGGGMNRPFLLDFVEHL